MSNEGSVDGPDGGGPRPEGGSPTRSHGRDVGPEALLHLTGEMDIVQAGLVRRLLILHIRATEDPAVVVDLSQVTFMDCAGLEPLLIADRWLVRRNRSLVLRPVSAPVEFLFTSLRRAGLVRPFEQPEGPDLALGEHLNNDMADDPDLADDPGPADDPDLVHLMDNVYAVEAARLRSAFEGRSLIDQATGVLMAVHECAAAEALGSLTRVARQHDMTTGDLAAGLAGLAAARGGRSTLDLSPAMKTAVRGVLARPGRSAAQAGPAP